VTSTERLTPPWLAPVAGLLEAAGRGGAFFVAFPQYRPALVKALADALGLAHLDFRVARMAELGWEAAKLPLSALTEAIEAQIEASGSGLVLHNAESLLAAKTSAERSGWLGEVAARAWPVPVIVPIAIFQSDLPSLPSRLCRLDPDLLPDESFLLRLASR